MNQANKPKRGDRDPVSGLFFWGTTRKVLRSGRVVRGESWVTFDVLQKRRKAQNMMVKEYQRANPSKRRAADAKMKAKRAKVNAALVRAWKDRNRSRWNATKRAHHKLQRSNPIYILKRRLRARIRHVLVRGTFKEMPATEIILGCTFPQFREHIEKQFKDGMSWARFSEIHIDHRLPLALAQSTSDIILLCHYTNLQPLWKTDNINKGAKLSIA
jgi:hypothetical protein